MIHSQDVSFFLSILDLKLLLFPFVNVQLRLIVFKVLPTDFKFVEESLKFLLLLLFWIFEESNSFLDVLIFHDSLLLLKLCSKLLLWDFLWLELRFNVIDLALLCILLSNAIFMLFKNIQKVSQHLLPFFLIWNQETTKRISIIAIGLK